MSVRKRFFELLKSKGYSDKDLECNELGNFTNKSVADMWKGFKLGIHTTHKDKGILRGHFVIARMRDDGTPCFSDKPRMHEIPEFAFAEQSRLTKLYPGSTFGIYNFIKSTKT